MEATAPFFTFERHKNCIDCEGAAIIMEDNKYFRQALSNFVSEAAYAGAVRHLYNAGYSVKKIKEEIGYPVSEEKIRKVIEDYEAAKNSPDAEYDFIQETDSLGRRSFRKVKKDK